MNRGQMVRPQPKALIELTLSVNGSVAGAYCSQPPFDATVQHEGSSRHDRPPVHPERIHLAQSRFLALSSALTSPAIVRLSNSRPWASGLALLAAAFVLAFYVSLPALPTWLLAMYILNAAALKLLQSPPADVWEPHLSTQARPSDAPSHSRTFISPDGSLPPAPDRLKALEDAVLPILATIESACSAAERFATAPLSADPRASIAFALPLLGVLFAATLGCTLASMAILLAGGARPAFFYVCVMLFVLRLASHHHRELRECLGGNTGDAVDSSELLAAARTNPFARPTPGRAPSTTAAPDTDRYKPFANVWRNLWLRIPDGPTQTHLAIARGAIQPAAEAGTEQRGFLASIRFI